ncbi:PQQ-binding-like beta-propeller repeat protein [Natrialba sp. INN-245]|uniref:PQQ-binding-like beta-propeller repeat protein n=1 Tax=Natrialba sp. INN-245 TaxID=2690967 RepID=UPI001312B5C6|nr:PQQ-binding-like beta-propeller repeat protein [Natrialba sp. INN-245]MWV40829.1 PQQ-binding-like beta-propeller repeat protein [Natrialba sp. INN-245]
MPSRRRLLAASSVSVAGMLGATSVLAADGGGRTSAAPSLTPDGTGFESQWPMARSDAAGSGFGPDASGPQAEVREAWTRDPDASIRGSAPPIVVGDTLYVVGRRSLAALERETGSTRFARDGPFFSTPALVETSAYRSDALALSGRAGIYGLDATGGYELPGRTVGLERWHAPEEPPSGYLSAEPREPSPVAVDGTVYAALPETDRIAAFDGNSGRLEWRYAVGGRHASPANRPAVRDGKLFASNARSVVASVDADTGEERWRVDLETVGSLPPTATNDGVVVPASNAVVFLDADDGEVVWTYDHGGNADRGSAAVADGTAFVSDGDEELHAIDLETGDAEWTAEYGHAASPAVADGVVYVSYYWTGELLAVDAETGERLWSYDDPTVVSQPVVGDGTVYVTTDDGVLALEEGS